MELIEKVSRALCRNDCESDPDQLLGKIAGDDRTFVWELYVDDAKAAIRAMLGGVEPAQSVSYNGGPTISLYPLDALKEAL